MSILTSVLSENLSSSSSLRVQNNSSTMYYKSDEILSSAYVRRKRYAVFPEGSTFTVSVKFLILSMTIFRPRTDVHLIYASKLIARA